jgi:hypothetical protein
MWIRTTALAAALALVPLAADASTAVKAPKSGQYSGRPGKLVLQVSGKSLDIVAFSFRCGSVSGRTALNSFPLKKTRRGYTFAIKAGGSIAYSDSQPDENGWVEISGRFSRSGRSAAGTWRVKSPRCGVTKKVHWRAAR